MLPTGTGTALATPFTPAGKLDIDALTRLTTWQIEEGVDFLVACGSTGEAQTLDAGERAEVVEIVVAAADGRVPVLAGATDNDTSRAVKEAKTLARLGVAGIMSASPYYNKPTQNGLIAHFRAIADAIEVPLLLYNVPGRSAVDMKAETVATLAGHPHIGGIKEASGNVRRMLDLVRQVPAEFNVMCGDDDIAVPAIAAGARGLISVASNALPRQIAMMVTAAREDRFEDARAAQVQLLPFIDAIFAESNPIPIKAALELLGRGSSHVRLPLVPVSAELRARLAQILEGLGVHRA